MGTLSPKVRSITCIIICALSAIIIRLLTDLNITIIIDILILIPGFIISYILSNKLDIRVSNIMFYVITLCSLFAINIFNGSSIALNLSISDWEKTVIKNIGNYCSFDCSIENRTIYSENNIEVYKWHGLSYVYEGTIKKIDDSLEYKISLENKCIVKELNKKYKVLNGKCD